jgi:hypothetical protein
MENWKEGGSTTVTARFCVPYKISPGRQNKSHKYPQHIRSKTGIRVRFLCIIFLILLTKLEHFIQQYFSH